MPTQPPAPSVAALRATLGLPRRLFSRLIGFSERVIVNWESGKRMSEPGRRRIREVERLRLHLAERVGGDAIAGWLDTPCPDLAGLKPLEAIERGEVDRIWRLIFRGRGEGSGSAGDYSPQ